MEGGFYQWASEHRAAVLILDLIALALLLAAYAQIAMKRRGIVFDLSGPRRTGRTMNAPFTIDPRPADADDDGPQVFKPRKPA